MINDLELKKGNWVVFDNNNKRHRQQHHVKILELLKKEAIIIDPAGLELSLFYKSDSILPIPLSPEVLKACGFTKFIDMEISKKEKKDIYTYFLKTDYVQITFVFGVTVLIGNDGFGKQAQCDISGKVKSLHQLQNLYFSLTGKELTYNPSK